VGFSAEGIKINDATVVSKNIDTSNGVVHVINAVLIPSTMSGKDVMDSLSLAIDRGVPEFNAGNHSRCCEIYMKTLSSINSAGIQGADNHTMEMIRQVLNNARKTHSKTDQAWVLRRGMDELYSKVSMMKDSMPMTTESSR
jgi:hypothetical protein